MATTSDATSSDQPERPGMKDGVCSEFTVFTEIKPGHADALRRDLAMMADGSADKEARGALEQIGTLHDARHVMFDNDTRHMFASVFDGSWDTYIDDFGKTVIGERFDRVFSHTEGFPGITDPGVKDWFLAHQAPAGVFVSSYPDLTVQQIWKDQRVSEAFQAVLDTPEFRAALDNPANAELLASPAFRRLMEEAER
ncbi:hypothetical protein [Streptomyces ochraceiscleroticus]|uniref:Uncharacterized protein n=1 Tax=Streptomyces ochraceiscleroticus TaxID=47761 RepID=A0ABW1MUZ2_9ACTN|nr:hypothetical protein [Streptomyces ochraceiscleroticus]